MKKGTLKICHLTSVHVPFDTRIFYKECKSLADSGYDVHLIASHEQDEEINGVHLHAVPKLNGKIKRMLFTTRAVYKKALMDQYDVYHFHDPELIPYGLLLKLRGKKVIYDVHEDYPEYFKYKDAFPPVLRKPLAKLIGILERFTAGYFDATVTVTPTIYKRFKLFNDCNFLIHNFPSQSEFLAVNLPISWQSKSNAVVYVGSLTLDRGIKEMVEAIGMVQQKVPARLFLAGEFTRKSDEETIKHLPGFSFVNYLGYKSREETCKLFAQAKIGIILCHPYPHYQRAYPTKLFEYMSAGIPVISSNFPLWKSIIDSVRCGLAVNPFNPVELAEAILYLLLNPEEAEDMGERGREAVGKKYNWNKEKCILLSVYEKILEKKV